LNHTIRKITSGGVVTTLAGLAGNFGCADGTNSKARFNRPAAVALDAANNLFVADSFNHTIRKITPSGSVSTIAGLPGVWGNADGTNTSARFFQPDGIVVKSSGEIFVSDTGNHALRKITSFGTNWIVTTVAGLSENQGALDGTGTVARFHFPAGLAKDSAGYIYVADFGNNMIRTERLIQNYMLNAMANPSVGGTIQISPAQTLYSYGVPVSLTAVANPGFSFVGWSGDFVSTSNQISVVTTSNRTFVANFISTAELILDNPDATFTGVWTTATSAPDKFGSYYQYASTVIGLPNLAEAVYRPNILTPGKYDVAVWYPTGTNRSTQVPVLVSGSGDSVNVSLDQTTGGGAWRTIATGVDFAAGTSGFVDIKNNSGETTNVVVADAVRFTYNSTPLIFSQPHDQTVRINSNATFEVLAGAGGQIHYQWQFNEVDIPGATNSSFTVTNAQPENIGGYSVIVSNKVGAVPSEVAALQLLPPTQFNSFNLQPDGRFHFVLTGESGLNYVIETSTNLTNWVVLTNLSSPDGLIDFIDPTPGNDFRFYRARSSP
jgi:hypothetical protein